MAQRLFFLLAAFGDFFLNLQNCAYVADLGAIRILLLDLSVELGKASDLGQYFEVLKHGGTNDVVHSQVFVHDLKAIFKKSAFDDFVVKLIQEGFFECP
jgi:hypothetical protein